MGAEAAKFCRTDFDLFAVIVPVMAILGGALWYHSQQRPFRFQFLNTLESSFIGLDLLAMALALVHSQVTSPDGRAIVATILSVVCAGIIAIPFILLFISLRDPDRWWVDLDPVDDGKSDGDGRDDGDNDDAKTKAAATQEVAMTPLARKPSKDLAVELAAITRPKKKKARRQKESKGKEAPRKEESFDSV